MSIQLLLLKACPLSLVFVFLAFPGRASVLTATEPVITKECAVNGHKRLKATILIHASPEVVWQNVHRERQIDPDIAGLKVLNQGQDQMIIEERFVLLPVIGSATCVIADKETPFKRIDYQLVKSDHFKSMEGSWVLNSCDGGRSTILSLSSYLELGIPVPRILLDGVTSQKLKRRVLSVKQLSEKAAALSEKKPAADLTG